MPRKTKEVMMGADMDNPSDPSNQGGYASLTVKILYPGSKISDVKIGNRKYQINNEDLMMAATLHDDTCDTEGG